MDDPTTTATLDQADEDMLTYTASDDALEAAAGFGANEPSLGGCNYTFFSCGTACDNPR
jgi:hypothetical protein